jgi:hypothetical protein
MSNVLPTDNFSQATAANSDAQSAAKALVAEAIAADATIGQAGSTSNKQTLNKLGFSTLTIDESGEWKPKVIGIDIVENLETFEKFRETKERPLTRTEQLLSNTVRNALYSGDAKSVVEALAALNENPASVRRVLSNLRQELGGPGMSIRWETGTNDEDAPFTRLTLDLQLRTGGTTVTIGSDGMQTATTWNYRIPGGDRPISADEALRSIYPPKEVAPPVRMDSPFK